MAKSYVRFETPKDIAGKLINAISVAKDTGKIRKGSNEATKAIESGKTMIVVIAEDVDPEEIVMHLPLLCEEKGIPYAYVPSKMDLGKAAGLGVQCAAIAIDNAGGAKDVIDDVVQRLGQKKVPAKEEKVEKKAPAVHVEVKEKKAGKKKEPKEKKEEKK
jgi:large subunit ribosomal protein L7Ae